MIDPISIGIGVVGLGASLFGDIKQSNKEAEAAEKDAANKRLQAVEVERRSGVRAGLMEKEGQKLLHDQIGYYAHAGVEMQGSPLLMMEQTNKDYHDEIYEMVQESNFRASQLRAGADFQDEGASDLRRSGYLRGATSLANFGYKTYSIFGDRNSKGNPAPRELPEVRHNFDD